MKKQTLLLKFEILNTIIILTLGILLHFTYNWSNQNVFVGIFSAVNESTWEHLKLLFFPMFITTIISSIYLNIPNYICAKTKGILVSISFLIIFFYTYTGVLGINSSIINIVSFFIATFLGQYYSYKNIKNNFSCNQLLALLILFFLFFSFILFTFFPPEIGLFKDPISDTFGIRNL